MLQFISSDASNLANLQLPGSGMGRELYRWFKYTPPSLSFVPVNVDLRLTDGATHQLAAYVELPYTPPTESVQVLNAVTGAVLDSEAINASTPGQYLVWRVSGHVVLQFKPNVSAVFLDS